MSVNAIIAGGGETTINYLTSINTVRFFHISEFFATYCRSHILSVLDLN